MTGEMATRSFEETFSRLLRMVLVENEIDRRA
jgi:hypothetical protein